MSESTRSCFVIVGKLCRLREQHSVHQKFGLESCGGPVCLGIFVVQPHLQVTFHH